MADFQSTQPISIASSVAVTGTFYQATQPVSGTFWQATQPVSIASMPSTPVTGTFWQAIQPISGTVTTSPVVAVSSTVTAVSVSLSTLTTVLVSNANRRSAIITIPSAATYVKFGTGAAANSFTYKTPAANTVIETEIWTGIITVFGPAQTVMVTELV